MQERNGGTRKIIKTNTKHKINNVGIFILIVGIIIMIAWGIGFLILEVDKIIEDNQRVRCASHYLENAMNFNNFYYVCGDEDCRSYFENRTIQNIEWAGECLEEDED